MNSTDPRVPLTAMRFMLKMAVYVLVGWFLIGWIFDALGGGVR